VGIKDPIQVTEPLTFDFGGAHARGTLITVANSGTSPAINASILGHLVVKPYYPTLVDKNPFGGLIDDKQINCEPGGFPLTLYRNHVGLFLLPGETKPLPNKADWMAYPQEIPNTEFVKVFLVGCLGYTDETAKSHGTFFVYIYVPDHGDEFFPPSGQYIGHFETFGLTKAY
jgi:hypothetical protein